MGLTGMSILAQHDRNLMMGNLLEGWKLAEGEDVLEGSLLSPSQLPL
jgi:hypothetical protein